MVREPLLTTVAIKDLRPTQITVGLREVSEKRKRWRDTGTRKGEKFLGKHMMPVVLGPKHRHYIIDHHHLALALYEEDVRDVAVTIVANLSALEIDAFWLVMDDRSWMHPFDADGRRRHYRAIPKSVTAMIAQPALKPVADSPNLHYVVCLQFNDRTEHRNKVVLFLGGTPTQYIDATPQQCDAAAYGPFPELQAALPRK